VLFDSEIEMKEVATESLPNSFGIQKANTIAEFDYGKGRTDLVFIDVSKSYWEHRKDQLDLPVPINNKHHLLSFLDLHGKDPVTKEYFLESGAQPEYKKQDALEWLVKNQFIKKTDSGKLRTAKNLRRHVTTTIAVELKLSKWKKALHQASRGRAFAEYKYVALDEDHISRAHKNIDKFKSNNVGLLSINKDGDVTVYWTPERNQPYSELYRWKLNELSIPEITA